MTRRLSPLYYIALRRESGRTVSHEIINACCRRKILRLGLAEISSPL